MSEVNYLHVMHEIMTKGENRNDRTGVGTRSLFGQRIEWDLRHSFPAISTKRLFWRGVVEELLWMLRGSGDISELTKRDVHIWDEWDGPDKWAPYGPMLRGRRPSFGVIDQFEQLLRGLVEDPNGRRHIMTTWNPNDLADPNMALPPCHGLVIQFHVTNNGHLDCQVYQRSADMFLGVPFNLASYGLLTHIVAHQTGLIPGRLIWVGGDCHIYSNHMEQVREQLHRPIPYAPQLRINATRALVGLYKASDFELVDYTPLPSIKAEVAV